MGSAPFFSVIVPVYNVKKYLPQCLDSILSQTFKDFEVIIVDDGSTDGSSELCDKYADSNPSVKVIHKQNGGLSSARNAGLRIAKGKYIIFIDSDDYWNSNTALTKINYTIESEVVDLAVLKIIKFNQKTELLDESYSSFKKEDFLSVNYDIRLKQLVEIQLFDTCACNKVFSSELLKHNDLFFKEGIIAEDIDWAARLALASKSITIVEEPIYVYRIGRTGAITTSLKFKNIIDTKGSIERCLNYPPLKNKSEDFLQAYYSYVAYRYIIWMAESAAVKSKEKKPLIEDMKKYSRLLNYDLNHKVKFVKKVKKILGFNLTSYLLSVYLKSKR